MRKWLRRLRAFFSSRAELLRRLEHSEELLCGLDAQVAALAEAMGQAHSRHEQTRSYLVGMLMALSLQADGRLVVPASFREAVSGDGSLRLHPDEQSDGSVVLRLEQVQPEGRP